MIHGLVLLRIECTSERKCFVSLVWSLCFPIREVSKWLRNKVNLNLFIVYGWNYQHQGGSHKPSNNKLTLTLSNLSILQTLTVSITSHCDKMQYCVSFMCFYTTYSPKDKKDSSIIKFKTVTQKPVQRCLHRDRIILYAEHQIKRSVCESGAEVGKGKGGNTFTAPFCLLFSSYFIIQSSIQLRVVPCGRCSRLLTNL